MAAVGGGARARPHLRLAGYTVAISGCFLAYSLFQERIMTLPWGVEGERFRHSLFIICVNRMVTCAVAAATLVALRQPLAPGAPLAFFAVPALSNLVGSAAQYEALKYVSFPLQALAKCAKTVPVMAWGMLIGGRRYRGTDYACAAAVTGGCVLFVLRGSLLAPEAEAEAAGLAAAQEAAGVLGLDSTEWAGHAPLMLGLSLLSTFLVFDGLTSTSQDKLYAAYDMHSCNQLLWVTAWSAAASLLVLLASGQMLGALAFVARHPTSLGYILALSMVSTAVQLFIFFTIQQYGALAFAIMMVVRQWLSLVLSCVVFGHLLTPVQWMGTLLVIGGLVGGALSKAASRREAAAAGGAIKRSPAAADRQRPPRPGDVEKGALKRSALAVVPVIHVGAGGGKRRDPGVLLDVLAGGGVAAATAAGRRWLPAAAVGTAADTQQQQLAPSGSGEARALLRKDSLE